GGGCTGHRQRRQRRRGPTGHSVGHMRCSVLFRLLPWAVLIVTSVSAARAVHAWAEHLSGMVDIDRPLSNDADANRSAVTIINMYASPEARDITCVTTQLQTTGALIVHGNNELSELYHELRCDVVPTAGESERGLRP